MVTIDVGKHLATQEGLKEFYRLLHKARKFVLVLENGEERAATVQEMSNGYYSFAIYHLGASLAIGGDGDPLVNLRAEYVRKYYRHLRVAQIVIGRDPAAKTR